MRIELAPMEGITTYTYRNALNKYYGGIDTYFTPYISTHKTKDLNYKEIADLNPENNVGMTLIPQVLTADAEEFFHTAEQITSFGYNHINLNFGCPSGTVTPKGKGAGALIYPDKLERLLDEIFSKTDLKISVKTRMGFVEYEEWERLLQVYIKFPLKELIVHARVREDYYKGHAHIEDLAESLKEYGGQTLMPPKCEGGQTPIASSEQGGQTPIPLSYNGDIFTVNDYNRAVSIMQNIDAVMIGRGVIANPDLAISIKQNEKFDLNKFKEFNLELAHNYQEVMSGDKNALFKLKELWVYMAKTIERLELGVMNDDKSQPESASESNGTSNYRFDFTKPVETNVAKKLVKSIRKCNSIKEYESIIKMIRV